MKALLLKDWYVLRKQVWVYRHHRSGRGALIPQRMC